MVKEKQKVALVHDYLVQFGGAEKTLEAISEIFPDAPIYTGVYKKENFPPEFANKVIKGNSSKLFTSFTKYLSFLMPLVFEGFDLREYDIIISDSSCWAKGVLTRPDQLHISYIHTPPRFLYKYSVESTKRNSWYFKPFVFVIDSFLRVWDYYAAQRPDFLVANSKEVQARISKFYKRNAQVIYPPVDVTYKDTAYTGKLPFEKYYVALGRLVAYKNFDLLIKAFDGLDINLVVIGTGTEKEKLQNMAGKNIFFAGRASEEDKHALIHNSLGLINPVENEDFGIVPIEAMAHGKPVLAHRSGGANETIEEGKTGAFFNEVSVECLRAAVTDFNEDVTKGTFDSAYIKGSVKRFSKERFINEFSAFIQDKWDGFIKENA